MKNSKNKNGFRYSLIYDPRKGPNHFVLSPVRLGTYNLSSGRGLSHRQPGETMVTIVAPCEDENRIVTSSAFRRLQDKAQLYPLEQLDYARTRLTHTIEVASIASIVGDIIWKKLMDQKRIPHYDAFYMRQALRNAALLHDIGNPPFGHYGEAAIRSFFENKLKEKKFKILFRSQPQMKRDLLFFDGNVQAFRYATKLQFFGNQRSLSLTHATLGGFIKYPCDSLHIRDPKNPKFGFFLSERKEIEELANNSIVYLGGTPNPLTLIVESADDIANVLSDVEDGIKKNRITYQVFLENIPGCKSPYLSKFIDKFHTEMQEENSSSSSKDARFPSAIKFCLAEFRNDIIRDVATSFCNNYVSIMSASFWRVKDNKRVRNSLVECCDSFAVYEFLRDLIKKYVYSDRNILQAELEGETAIQYLLSVYCDSLLAVDLQDPNWKQNTKDKNTKTVLLISDNFLECYRRDYEALAPMFNKKGRAILDIYLKFRLATDYVCGMTDSYALRLYHGFGQ